MQGLNWAVSNQNSLLRQTGTLTVSLNQMQGYMHVAVTNLVARVGAEIVQEGLSSSEQEQEDIVCQDGCLYDVVSQLLIRSGKDVQSQYQTNDQHWHKLGNKKTMNNAISFACCEKALATLSIIKCLTGQAAEALGDIISH